MSKHYRNPIPVLPWVILALLLSVLSPCYALASISDPEPASDTAKDSKAEAYVNGLFKKIEETGRFVNSLRDEDMGKLPIGLVREINGNIYVIAIDSARMTTKGAYFSAYFRFPFPGTQSELIFGGKNIMFNPAGIGAGASTKMVLLNEKTIGINEHLDLTFPGDGSNFIEWDCSGFKSASLNGLFKFDKGWLQPEDTTKRLLTANMKVTVNDLNNIIAAIDIPNFRIAGLKDFSFRVKNAVMDMSDLNNPNGLKITKDMVEDIGNPLLWRGFYLQEIEVGLPSQLATKDGRPSVSVSNFFIDDQGVSGTVTADHIVKLGDASAGGWPLSIDKLGLTFSKNKLNGGELGGQMKIGFLGEDPLDYDAAISMRGGDTYYAFNLRTTDKKEYDFFAGKIILNKGSRIDVSKTDKDFIASATLNGKIELNKSALNVKDVIFQDLTLSTQKPYVHSGTFDISTNGNSKMSNFPIQFDSIHIGLSEGKVAIGADVRMSFMNSSDKGFSAATSFVVTAAQREETQTIMVNSAPVVKTTTHWSLDKVQINDIALEVKVMSFKMKGALTLFDEHPVYGNGFRGMLDFTLPGPIPKAKATAYFGSKDDYRYWHADVYVGVVIPIPPALKITGMMGGMSYHMERPNNFDPYDTRNTLDKNGGMKDLNEIFQYVPVKEAGLGFIGGVSLALTTDMLVNANTALEIQFGTDGSFRYAQFDGAGYILHKAEKAKSKNDAKEDESAPVWVQFKMRYDNVNNSFDANMKTYINISGILKGIYDRGLVGEAALHVASDDWWLYVGRPSDMFGLSVAGLAEIKSYFMMGTKVENMPLLPAEVSSLSSKLNTNFMAVENAMSSGTGLGFGGHFKAGFSFDYGVYGEFAIGAGADILLRNYGEDAKCKGSNSVIGFNGWYASGQAYAYLKGDVGIRVKVLRKKRSFNIAKLTAAVLLQAKLPNPSWFQGTVAVNYSVLGGLVKGSANIGVELGSQCEIVGAKEIDLEVISGITPGDTESDVSVFAMPQVAFNMPVATPFKMLNNNDEVETYRIKLDEFNLYKDNVPVKGEMTVSPEGTSATFAQHDIMPALSQMTASAKVHIEKQTGALWQALKTDGTNIDYEQKSTRFTTGKSPDYIPWENVSYVYPVKDQYNFLPREYNKGYVHLKMGQADLFKPVDQEGKKWKITAAFTAKSGQPLTTAVTYNEAQKEVNFDIPAGFSKETIYSFSIVRTSLDGENAENNVSTKTTTTQDESGETTITENNLKGTAASGITKEVIGYNLRTSKYNNFAEKMSAVTAAEDLWDIAIGYVTVIGQRFDVEETFDKFETEGEASFATKPLVYLTANMNNTWLRDEIMPLLYKGNPLATAQILNRNAVETWGVPPLDAVRLYNDVDPYKLEASSVSEGFAPSRPGHSRFMYYVSYVAHNDYMAMYSVADRNYLNGNVVSDLLRHTFPSLRGNLFYPVDFQYRLPGSNYITSSITKSIYYKL